MLATSVRWSRLVGSAGLAVALTAVTACGSSSSSFKEPSQESLQSALITAGEMGSPYTTDNSGGDDNSAPSGCPDLDNNLSNAGTGSVKAEADFSGGNDGPFLSEQLITEPESKFNSDLTETTDGLKTCRAVTLADSGQSITLTLKPATGFPSGTTADELSGTLQGVQISGDLAEQRIGSAALEFTYVQIGNASSQEAAAIYSKIVQKAQSQLR